MYTFLIPYRNREEQLKNCLINIHDKYPDSQILIGEQDDNLSFKKGQILNSLYRYSRNDLLIFIDVDCRIIESINFYELMKKFKTPFLPWSYRQECKEENGIIEIIKGERYSNGGYGGIFVFMKHQFEGCKGFSNLCSNWSSEDNILFYRTRYNRTRDNLYHIKHRNIPYEHTKECKKDPYVIHNRHILDLVKRKVIDPNEDGINQTTSDFELVHTDNPLIEYFKFKNISVVDSFIYKNLLPE